MSSFRPRWRQIWYFGIFALMMNSFLIVIFESVLTLYAKQVASSSPALTSLLNTTMERFNDDSDAFRTNDTTFRDLLQQMDPISSQINWFMVALVSSLLAFSLVGFFYARLSGRTDWIGAFPLISILTGQNPGRLTLTLFEHGVSGTRLSLVEQAVVIAVQLLAVYACGATGWLMHRRRQARVISELP